MDHVTMGFNFSGRAVIWNGSSATIVSSQFYESGGLRLDATSNEVVNSVFREKDRRAVDRIVSTGGPVRVDASTFFWSEPVCAGCLAPNLGFVTGGTGVFDLHSTAIGSGANYPGAQPLLWGNTATGFTSDNLTWVQPTGTQDAAAIATILPNALTDAPGLNPSFIGGDISDVTPIIGTLPAPGVLIDAVDPGQCPHNPPRPPTSSATRSTARASPPMSSATPVGTPATTNATSAQCKTWPPRRSP